MTQAHLGPFPGRSLIAWELLSVGLTTPKQRGYMELFLEEQQEGMLCGYCWKIPHLGKLIA